MDLDSLLRALVAAGGSDLHLKPGAPPHVRVDGQLVAMPDPALAAADCAALAAAALPPDQRARLESEGEVELARGVAGLGRFRITAYRQRGSTALAVRRVAAAPPPLEELGLPVGSTRLVDPGRGLVLVGGPAGSGRTTTLHALIDHVNRTRPCHIVTVESPVEHLHADRLALVSQREVGADAPDAPAAVARAGHIGADVVAVGDLSAPSTVRAALAAAEGGALVIGVVPGTTATEALAGVIAAHGEHERERARAGLSRILRGVLAQRLVERADGRGRVAAVEVVVGTPKIAAAVAQDRLGDLVRLAEEGEYNGMQTLDRALVLLAREGMIAMRDAAALATDAAGLELAVGAGVAPTPVG